MSSDPTEGSVFLGQTIDSGITKTRVPISGTKGRTKKYKDIYTGSRFTRTGFNPSTFKQEIVQYENAKGTGIKVQIATKNQDTNKWEFNLGTDYKDTDETTFKNLVAKESKNQLKDARKKSGLTNNESLNSIFKNESNGKDKDEQAVTTNNTLEIAAKRNKNTRTSYGNYCYPVTLRRGNQDRLKISVLQRDINDFKNLRLRGRRAPEKTIGSVVLPVPGKLNDNNRVDFKNGTLNPLEVAIGELGLTAFLNTGNAGEQAAKTVRNIFSDTGSLKGITASLFTGRLINRGANDIFARSQNAIINPNIETLFNGPTLRPFNFGFRLSPRDRGESIEVKKIIRMFKQSSAVQSSPVNFFLKTPNTFKLQFFDGSSTFSNSKFGNHDFLPKIKECALLGFGVDYTPDGTFMSYENSSMVSYDITFAFQELDPILNEDYTLLDSNTDQSIGF